ncbi:MAG: CHAT domain [Phormidium sp. OSCR]|nr:MAG: CHAT domain [Phormidium sp. OSCR]
MLSQAFERAGIDCQVYSNDGIWDRRTFLNRSLLQKCLSEGDVDVVHLALHGDRDGLVLGWSKAEKIRDRRPQERLSPQDITQMSQWRGKLIISGAASVYPLADAFLNAGASGVIVPERSISYQHLVPFLDQLYSKLANRQAPRNALDSAIRQFPDLDSFRFLSSGSSASSGIARGRN